MSAENEKLIDVRFDGSSINITIMETIDGISSSTPIPPITIVNDTNLDYNAGVTNLGHIKRYMMLRTICDIRKDAINATIPVCNRNYLTHILKQIFPEPENLVDKATLPKLEEIKF